MAANWNFSDWIDDSLFAPGSDARRARLSKHIREVSDRITENYSIAGRSKGVDSLNAYLSSLKADYAKLGGSAPRARGRSRQVRIDHLQPQGID